MTRKSKQADRRRVSARQIEEAKGRVAAMTPEELAAMYAEQRDSLVRGEMAIGLDADEAKWRVLHEWKV